MSDSLESQLKEIRTIMQDVKSVLVLANQDKLAEAKKRLLPENSMKFKIYQLCDSTKTTKQIAEALAKDEAYVRANLSVLRREGLIRALDREGIQLHEQIF